MKNTKLSIFLVLLFAAGCACGPEKSSEMQDNQADSLYLTIKAQGKQVAGLSFSALSQRLQHAIGERGLEGALAFCNVHALPITDSLSEAMNVSVSRTALRFRNPENAPDELDKQIMERFQQMIAQFGKASDTLVRNLDGDMVYMAPIITLPACLQCHGVPEMEIKPQTMDLVRALYPDDRAIGFREGELRGMWKVKFNTGQSRIQ